MIIWIIFLILKNVKWISVYAIFDKPTKYFEIFANISKAKKLGWNPTKSLENAIFDTADYIIEETKSGNIIAKDFMKDLDIEKIKI